MRNTVSFYMRILRAVYNRAVEQHLVAVHREPFRKVYTGVDKTRKRAIDENVILQLQQLDLNSHNHLRFARDMFVFSYGMRGMAFVDMAYLRKDNVIKETVVYSRRKTGQRLSVRIEPCIDAIIKRYSDASAKSPYIFPIITSFNREQAYLQYQSALGYYNHQLKQLAGMVGVSVPLSSYTSRHTWATAARKHNVPLAVISEGMGHTSEQTTRIYLASLDNSVIDQANQSLLSELNDNIFNKKCRLYARNGNSGSE